MSVSVRVNEMPKALRKYAFFAHNMPHGHGQYCVVLPLVSTFFMQQKNVPF